MSPTASDGKQELGYAVVDEIIGPLLLTRWLDPVADSTRGIAAGSVKPSISPKHVAARIVAAQMLSFLHTLHTDWSESTL